MQHYTNKLNNVICDDESFTLTATAGGIGGATYVFSINSLIAETITTTVTQTSVSYTPPLPYTSSMTISVEVTTPSGCVSTASLIVLENAIQLVLFLPQIKIFVLVKFPPLFQEFQLLQFHLELQLVITGSPLQTDLLLLII